MKWTIHVIGIRPLLQHNGRLANPIDDHARAVKALTAKRKKTDEDYIAIMLAEARGAVYETDDGLLGMPVANVWRCLFDAAKAYKRGEDVKRALTHEPMVEPLLVAGDTITVDEFLKHPENIDYRPVAVQRAKTMRARPIVRDWSMTATFDLLDDIIDPRDLDPVRERAGRVVCLGDWRPIYGAFTSEVE